MCVCMCVCDIVCVCAVQLYFGWGRYVCNCFYMYLTGCVCSLIRYMCGLCMHTCLEINCCAREIYEDETEHLPIKPRWSLQPLNSQQAQPSSGLSDSSSAIPHHHHTARPSCCILLAPHCKFEAL